MSGDLKIKKKTKRGCKGKGSQMRAREKLFAKLPQEAITQCVNAHCLFKNFSKYEKCLRCDSKLPEKLSKVVFYDLERQAGPYTSEVIQIGAVKVEFPTGRVIGTFEVNIFPKKSLERRDSLFSHRIFKKDGRLFYAPKKDANGRAFPDYEIPSTSPAEARQSFLAFIEGSVALMAHGEDDITLESFFKSEYSVEFMGVGTDQVSFKFADKKIKLINTQHFFKRYCLQMNMVKFGLAALVSMLGDEETKEAYKNAHNALIDSKCLKFVCLESVANKRFKDWLALEMSGEANSCSDQVSTRRRDLFRMLDMSYINYTTE